MGGPLIFAVIAALLCTVGGRPQSNNQRSVSRAVLPFSRSDSRDTYVSSDRQTAHGEHRPHQANSYRDDAYQTRTHSDQIQQSSIANLDRQRLTHDANRAKDRKRQEEQPMWLPRTDQSSNQGRDSPAHSSANIPHDRNNRGSNRQEHNVAASRGQSGNSNRPLTRMGSVEVPDDEYTSANNDSARRLLPTTSPMNTGEIVFPGPTRDPNIPKVSPGSFAPQVGDMNPNCAQGSTFCESTDNYPSDYLKNVLRVQADAFKDFFGNDELNELTQRIDLTDETPLCPSVEQVVYPKMAQNKEDKWLFVVNQDPYVQGVRVEKCLRQESECSLTESFPLGYKTICRQKYIYRRMLALNEDGKTHSDMFRLPSCCACFVKAVGATGTTTGSR